MSGSKLDQLVKGAPPPGTSVPTVLSRSPTPAPPAESAEPAPSRSSTPLQLSDPLAALPSSPPQIYLNLLILEASLRSQYLALRSRRKQNTFFLLLLSIWIICFSYALFLRPREDGSGVGGSVYWVVEMAEKVALMGGIVTAILVWGTGQWDRGIRWPRRWVGVANRGLRNINAKVVIIKGPWWRETFGHLSLLFPYSSFFPSQGSSYYYTDHLMERPAGTLNRAESEEFEMLNQEDLSPGGDHIKLLLLPKPFSPEFRENWELYRLEYWEKENEGRTQLLQRFQRRQRHLAKEQGGWCWWIGWRGWRKPHDIGARRGDIEKIHYRRHSERDIKTRHSVPRSDSQSRTTSRSSTPTNLEGEERPLATRVRRGSGNSTSERRKKVKSTVLNDSGYVSRMTPVSTAPGASTFNEN